MDYSEDSRSWYYDPGSGSRSWYYDPDCHSFMSDWLSSMLVESLMGKYLIFPWVNVDRLSCFM